MNSKQIMGLSVKLIVCKVDQSVTYLKSALEKYNIKQIIMLFNN
jgi:hypothetical protein